MKKRMFHFILASAICVSLYQVAGAYEASEVLNGGKISGVVKLHGKAIQVKALAITKNKDVCGQSTPDPRYVIGKGGAVKNVIVTIEGIEKGKKALPVKGAVLDNKKCVFLPHVQAVTVGTRLTVMNSDSILHNTHTSHIWKCPVGGNGLSHPLLSGCHTRIK